jgi:hypothetical protein
VRLCIFHSPYGCCTQPPRKSVEEEEREKCTSETKDNEPAWASLTKKRASWQRLSLQGYLRCTGVYYVDMHPHETAAYMQQLIQPVSWWIQAFAFPPTPLERLLAHTHTQKNELTCCPYDIPHREKRRGHRSLLFGIQFLYTTVGEISLLIFVAV